MIIDDSVLGISHAVKKYSAGSLGPVDMETFATFDARQDMPLDRLPSYGR